MLLFGGGISFGDAARKVSIFILFFPKKSFDWDGDAFFDELSLLRNASAVAVAVVVVVVGVGVGVGVVFPRAVVVDTWTPSLADNVIFDSEAVLFG